MAEENYELDEDCSLESEDKAKVGSNNQEWLKMTKGQIILASFLYFHTVDRIAVGKLRKTNPKATADEVRAAAKAALDAKGASLTPPKTGDQLTAIEKLDLSMVQFKTMKAHYQQGFGYAISRLGKDGPEADAVWKRLGDPKQYLTTLLLVYPMNSQGKHDLDAIKRGEYRFIPWRFGKGTYDEIWNLNDGLRSNGMSLASQDLKIECKESQYQNMKIAFAGKALWQSNPKFRDKILTDAIEFYDKLVPFREMTTDQVRQKLGMSSPPTQDITGGEEFSNLLESV